MPLEIVCWPRSVSCLWAVVLPPSHFLIHEPFHSPLPLLVSSVVLVHESFHHITPLVATPLFLVHESSHSSILPPVFSSAMPYFAFFSLFLNALLNDTFHPLLGILALLFCITPLARLSPCFHSRKKTSVTEGSTWYVRIVSKQNPLFLEHPYLTHISKENSFFLSSHISLLNG